MGVGDANQSITVLHSLQFYKEMCHVSLNVKVVGRPFGHRRVTWGEGLESFSALDAKKESSSFFLCEIHCST